MNAKILICEDEKNIAAFLKAELERAGFLTHTAYDGEEALQLFSQSHYDLVLLDLMLPRKSGLETLQAIRQASQTPVIILTARKDTFDKVLLLKTGADDYVTKPFDTLELLARIERNIRRSQAGQSVTIRELSIHAESFVCLISGQELSLTKTEFEILLSLCQNADKVLTRSMLMHRLYGEQAGDTNVIDVNIKNIRRKIALLSSEAYIQTVRGIGYVVRLSSAHADSGALS